MIIIRTNEYFDNDVKLKSRIFYAMAITGCFANTFGFIANAIIFGFTSGTIICGICDIIVLSSFILGIATHHINVAMWIILLLINYFEFPFLYVLYGKDTFIYTILGLIAILLYTNTKQRYFFVSAAFVADIAAIILRQRHPELNQATHDMTGSLIASYTIAFGAACALMNIYISQHRKQNELLTNLSNQLIETAHTDALTQVYNRRYLMEYLEEKQNSAEAYNGCALLTDLDFFKSVNDTYGHVFGDDVLKEFAAITKHHVGENGMVSRFGGEEFMIIFEITDIPQIKHIMTEIKEEFAEYSQREKGIQLTFSGGAQLFDNSVSITELFSTADNKLYQAKESGRNNIVF